MTSTSLQQTQPAERNNSLTHLIISILALYARPEGNWLPIATIVDLMGTLDAASQAVRSSISRLKRRGVLISERRDGIAGYSLSPETLEVVAEGDIRIFRRPRAKLQDAWVVVVFSVPESEREKRHALRVLLTRLGFGTVAPGVWIAPGTLASETRHTLDRRGLSSYVDMFEGQYTSTRDLSTEIQTWWNLEELSSLYQEFLDRNEPTRALIKAGALDNREAFQAYVPMLTEWRRLPYRDPGIPIELLPIGWKGKAAAALFEELNSTLRPLARKFVLRLIHGNGEGEGTRSRRSREEA